MKKTFRQIGMVALAAIGMMLFVISPAYAANDGDVTGDGKVNVSDVQCEVLLNLYVLAGQTGPTPVCLASGDLDDADANCDGVINISDAVVVTNIALENLPEQLDCDRNGLVDDCEEGTVECPSCDDGNLCTFDSISFGECIHTPVNCTDGNACTTDSCDPTTGCVNEAIEGCEACDAPSDCSNFGCGATCEEGVCGMQANAPTMELCIPSDCQVDVDCEQFNTICSEYVCVAPLGQGNACFKKGEKCNDEDACTADSCNVVTGCVNTPVDCSDGDACTEDSCDSQSGCQNMASDCDDGDPCTTDSCNPATGCVNDPTPGCEACVTDGDCDDGDPCTKQACGEDGLCTVSQMLAECTGTSCTKNSDCDDANACTLTQCDTGFGACKVIVAIECNDDDVCTTDTCDPTTGDCMNTATSCNDDDPCTMDSCDPATGCSNTPVEEGFEISAACVDAGEGTFNLMVHVCQGGEHVELNQGECLPCEDVSDCPQSFDTSSCVVYSCLLAGYCQASYEDELCDDGFTCSTEFCNTEVGECEWYVYHEECDDGNACTVEECQYTAGCNSDTIVNCDDDDACTTDSCNPELGCQHVAVDCGDNNACTTDSCDPLLGCQNEFVNCNDGDACTTDSCDSQTGCQNMAMACDDGDACTADWCAPDIGCQHDAVDCNDNDLCTTDSCDPATGCMNAAVEGCFNCEADQDCNDDNACTSEACGADGICEFTQVSCDDGDECTTDSCDPVDGCQHEELPGCGNCNVKSQCNDFNACTTDSCVDHLCVHESKGGCEVCESDEDCEEGATYTEENWLGELVFTGTCNVAKGTCNVMRPYRAYAGPEDDDTCPGSNNWNSSAYWYTQPIFGTPTVGKTQPPANALGCTNGTLNQAWVVCPAELDPEVIETTNEPCYYEDDPHNYVCLRQDGNEHVCYIYQ